jgi:hypothetical protein
MKVYGVRYDDDCPNVAIYLHRLKGGGWVEHDACDTYWRGVMDPPPLKNQETWYPTDLPPFDSCRARYWDEEAITGLKKGNARIKDAYYFKYNFSFL